ncbi:von Willebrand factor type A domain-containing protein, partial [Planctomycetota bacterium]
QRAERQSQIRRMQTELRAEQAEAQKALEAHMWALAPSPTAAEAAESYEGALSLTPRTEEQRKKMREAGRGKHNIRLGALVVRGGQLRAGETTRLPWGAGSGDLLECRRAGEEARTSEVSQGYYEAEGIVDSGTELHNTEAYDTIVENPFLQATENPRSTFSVDVDTASYSNVRRHLLRGALPPKGAVRVEELLNYFSYEYPQPLDADPFSVHLEVAGCPWRAGHRLVRIGLKGREVPVNRRPPSNLVFLVDVSGSMRTPQKLPLVKHGLRLLVDRLDGQDRVAMVVYAGASGVVLPSTPASDQQTILKAVDGLEAGGSTNGGAGIELAYLVAMDNLIRGGVNRVILATDGDFNVGVTNQGSLIELIEEKAKGGVFLSVLGFGMGNYKDSTLEKLADKGNGNYAYIDTRNEARKVLAEELSATLVTIAKDVKVQVEFNPVTVKAYRLIGYENRVLTDQDFNDDTKDAGEIGAGHTVTALYEIIPADLGDQAPPTPSVDPLKYQEERGPSEEAYTGELLAVKLRYKKPDGNKSSLLSFAVVDRGTHLADSSADFKFAAAVAAFGMILRDSEHKGSSSLAGVLELADEGLGADQFGYRAEFLDLVSKAREIR